MVIENEMDKREGNEDGYGEEVMGENGHRKWGGKGGRWVFQALKNG